jgi:alpha-tubulin suppressor-like RCC1 family protein
MFLAHEPRPPVCRRRVGVLAATTIVLGAACSRSGLPIDGASTTTIAPTTVSISAGGDHTCVVTAAGAVRCWGYNVSGELGNGSYVDSPVPVDVVGLSSGGVAVSAGGFHTCALTAAGGAKCWGSVPFIGNDSFDNGSSINSPVPVDVMGLSSGVVAVSAGYEHACALTAAGAVKCWGYDVLDGSAACSEVPVDVVGLSSGVVAVSAGGIHTCALTAAGAVKCWGNNLYGDLGDGSTVGTLVPVDVVGLSSGVVAVSAGANHTCALTAAGAVKCWGYNMLGGLGNGSAIDSPVPVDVVGLSSGVVAVSAGGDPGGPDHTCALTAAGAVECWGINGDGELGDGSTEASLVPVDVVGLSSGVVAVSTGWDHTCAVTAAGAVECWGWNLYGQLGNGSTNDGPGPVPVDVMGL